MRIVVSGYYGCRNAGDEWVLAGMLRSFRALVPGLEIEVLSGDPERTERQHEVSAVPRMQPLAVATALRRADGLVSGGGSLLQDSSSARPVAYYTGVAQLAAALGRPYVIHAQGLGPIRRAANRVLAGRALRNAAAVSLRDPGSVALARELGVDRPIEVVPDPALALEPTAIVRPGPAPIVVAIRDWPAAPPFLEPIHTALTELSVERAIVALPMQEPDDRGPSLAAIAGIEHASVVDATAGLETRAGILAGAELVMGMRLHALILAAASGVPAIALSYDPKVDAFAGIAGQEVAGDVTAGLDAPTIVRAARSALSGRSGADAGRIAELRAGVARSSAASLAALGLPVTSAPD
jgi:polysaccharide pyruvyl transferase CsaB